MLLDFLLGPNIAYVVLVIGFWLTVMAVLTPGTGVFEITALFAYAFAGWRIFNLPIHWWALALMILASVRILTAAMGERRIRCLSWASVALVIGSMWMFQGEGWRPGVNPVLAIVMSGLSSAFVWFVTIKAMDAHRSKPAHELESLIGSDALTRTEVHFDGAILVKKEEWSARSDEPIPPETPVRITGREGFVLLVEPINNVEEA